MVRVKQKTYKKGSTEFILRQMKNKGITLPKHSDTILKREEARMKRMKNLWQTPLKEIYTLEEDEDFENIIENIRYKKPTSPFALFFKEEVQKFKDKKMSFREKQTIIQKNWKKLSPTQTQEYCEEFSRQKAQYEKDKKLVLKYLFLNADKETKVVLTAHKYFESEEIIKNFDGMVCDYKTFKAETKKKWDKLPKKEKEAYKDRCNEIQNWITKGMKLPKLNSVSLFVQRQFEEKKKNKEPIPSLWEVQNKWKELSSEEKKKYKTLAEEMKAERELYDNVYRLINNIPIRKPVGAFRLFYHSILKENEGDKINIETAKDLWSCLSFDKKEDYEKENHRLMLAYRYKQMVKKKQIQDIFRVKKPGSLFNIFMETKKGQKVPDGADPATYWKSQYDKLSITQINKLKEKKSQQQKVYDDYMEQFKGKKFDMPPKPLNCFNIYIRENLDEIKNFDKDKTLFTNASALWKKLSSEKVDEYKQKAELEKKIYKQRLHEFNISGCYSEKYEPVDDEDEDGEKKKKSKKKRSSSFSSQKSKDNKKQKSCKKKK